MRDRRTQVVLEGAPFAQPLVHVGFEETDRAAAFRLGAIERGIGIDQERVRIESVGRIDRDPDAQADPKLLAADLEIPGHRRLQTIRKGGRGRRLRPVGGDQRELIAAEPRQEDPFGDRVHPPGYFAQ